MNRAVGDFFDDNAERYYADEFGNQLYNEGIARLIERELDGTVLSVGGLWDRCEIDGHSYRILLADLSRRMLRAWAAIGPDGVCCDALHLPFVRGSMDHVVMPLILHHITGRSVREARRLVRQVLRSSLEVVRPGGRVWISDFLVPLPIYAAEFVLSPLTRATLALVSQTLVVMHSESFYRSALAETGWEDVRVQTLRLDEARPFDLVIPILGMPWLRVPRLLYPLKPSLISARRPA